MSAVLAHRAETHRLARVLGVDPEDLDFLRDAPTAALTELRHGIQDRLLERSRGEFERAVSLADRIPRALAATLAQKVMGPVLGGRAASLLSPGLTAELSARLPPDFLADVAGHVDLRHVGPLIGGIPTDTMAATGRVLRRREEWIVLSAFVGHVPEAKLRTLLDVFDGEALLRSGFVIEDASRLDAVMEMLSDARLDELLVAAFEHELWAEAVGVAGLLGDDQSKRVIAAIERLPEARLETLARAIESDPQVRAGSEHLARLAPDHLRAQLASLA